MDATLPRRAISAWLRAVQYSVQSIVTAFFVSCLFVGYMYGVLRIGSGCSSRHVSHCLMHLFSWTKYCFPTSTYGRQRGFHCTVRVEVCNAGFSHMGGNFHPGIPEGPSRDIPRYVLRTSNAYVPAYFTYLLWNTKASLHDLAVRRSDMPSFAPPTGTDRTDCSIVARAVTTYTHGNTK